MTNQISNDVKSTLLKYKNFFQLIISPNIGASVLQFYANENLPISEGLLSEDNTALVKDSYGIYTTAGLSGRHQ